MVINIADSVVIQCA